MTGVAVTRTLVVFALAVVCLTAFSAALGDRFGQAWLPLFEYPIDMLLGEHYRRESLEVRTLDGTPSFVLQATVHRALQIGPAVLPEGTALSTSILQGYAAAHFVIVFSVLLAWPVSGLRHRMGLLVLGVPAVAVAMLLDVPFVLTGLVYDLVLGSFAPERVTLSWSVGYYDFLHRGGRYAIALSLAAAVVVISRRFVRRAARPP